MDGCMTVSFASCLSRCCRCDICSSVASSRVKCSCVRCIQCDIGLFYDEPRHCLLNKWILLHIPDDTLAGATGYIKISAALLGPGDDVPVSLLLLAFSLCTCLI